MQLEAFEPRPAIMNLLHYPVMQSIGYIYLIQLPERLCIRPLKIMQHLHSATFPWFIVELSPEHGQLNNNAAASTRLLWFKAPCETGDVLPFWYRWLTLDSGRLFTFLRISESLSFTSKKFPRYLHWSQLQRKDVLVNGKYTTNSAFDEWHSKWHVHDEIIDCCKPRSYEQVANANIKRNYTINRNIFTITGVERR